LTRTNTLAYFAAASATMNENVLYHCRQKDVSAKLGNGRHTLPQQVLSV